MKTKKQKKPTPDTFGFYTKKDAYKLLEIIGVSFCRQSVDSAFRENAKDPDTGIPHQRSHPTKPRARIKVRVEDILKWLQQGNTTDVDITKAMKA